MDTLTDPQIDDDGLARQRLRLWLHMLKATRQVEAALREHLREGYGTTLPRFDVLAVLHSHPEGMKMSDLSKHLVVSNGNVTGVVNRLVADGLVERQNLASDRRAFVVRITEQGRSLMDEMVRQHLKWIDEMLANVSKTDAARGISIMLDIRHKN